MILDIHQQYGNARVLGQSVHFLNIRIGRNCYKRGLSVHNGSWRLVLGWVDVSWSRVL